MYKCHITRQSTGPEKAPFHYAFSGRLLLRYALCYMISIRELAELFDDTNYAPTLPGDNARVASAREQRPADGFWRPTAKSLPYIEKRLQFKLPASFLDFACASNSYAEMFLRLGEDYAKTWHILNVAAETRRIRRRKNGRWQYIRPKSLIPITVGYDSDYNCFDISRPGPFEGEFEICCWSTPMTGGNHYELDFPSYILKIILCRSVKRRGKEKEHYTRIYERTCTLLEEHENNILEALYGKA